MFECLLVLVAHFEFVFCGVVGGGPGVGGDAADLVLVHAVRRWDLADDLDDGWIAVGGGHCEALLFFVLLWGEVADDAESVLGVFEVIGFCFPFS